MNITNIALSTSDVEGIISFDFSDEFVNGSRALAVILSGAWVLWIIKDHMVPSNQPAMPIGQGRSGGSKVLTCLGLLLLVQPELINKVAVWPLQLLILVAGFIPPLRDAFDIESGSGGSVDTGGSGGYS